METSCRYADKPIFPDTNVSVQICSHFHHWLGTMNAMFFVNDDSFADCWTWSCGATPVAMSTIRNFWHVIISCRNTALFYWWCQWQHCQTLLSSKKLCLTIIYGQVWFHWLLTQLHCHQHMRQVRNQSVVMFEGKMVRYQTKNFMHHQIRNVYLNNPTVTSN